MLNDKLISRIRNWKFTQAIQYFDKDTYKEEKKIIIALSEKYGNIGWFTGAEADKISYITDELIGDLEDIRHMQKECAYCRSKVSPRMIYCPKCSLGIDKDNKCNTHILNGSVWNECNTELTYDMKYCPSCGEKIHDQQRCNMFYWQALAPVYDRTYAQG